MTAALLALAACAWWWLKALTIAGTAFYLAASLIDHWRRINAAAEERRRRRDRAAYIARVTLARLPAPDAPDEVFDDWHRAVVGLHPHRFATTAAQIAALPTTEMTA